MTTNRIEVSVSQELAATPEAVFDAWLDTTRPGGPWFGPQSVTLNAVEGGLFYHCVHHEGRDWSHYGRFTRLVRGKTIEHTWVSEATQGLESAVTITLEPKGEGTLLTLSHTNLPDDAMGRQHEEGWKFVTGALAERFGGPKS